eukprot:tig00001065_g6739.t1
MGASPRGGSAARVQYDPKAKVQQGFRITRQSLLGFCYGILFGAAVLAFLVPRGSSGGAEKIVSNTRPQPPAVVSPKERGGHEARSINAHSVVGLPSIPPPAKHRKAGNPMFEIMYSNVRNYESAINRYAAGWGSYWGLDSPQQRKNVLLTARIDGNWVGGFEACKDPETKLPMTCTIHHKPDHLAPPGTGVKISAPGGRAAFVYTVETTGRYRIFGTISNVGNTCKWRVAAGMSFNLNAASTYLSDAWTVVAEGVGSRSAGKFSHDMDLDAQTSVVFEIMSESGAPSQGNYASLELMVARCEGASGEHEDGEEKGTLLRRQEKCSEETRSTEGERKRLALVRPFIPEQIDLLLWVQKSYEEEHAFPCDLAKGYGQDVDIIYFFNKDLETSDTHHLVQKLVEGLEAMPKVRRCFDEIKFVSGYLTEDMDGHPDGTCYQFYHLFQNPMMARTYKYFFLFEPDVRPIKRYWLDAVYEETFDRNDFWLKGSVSQCGGDYAYMDFHINGNALYKLGDDRWLDYLQRVRSFYKPRLWVRSADGCSAATTGFDHSVYHFSREESNWHYAQRMLHRIVYSTFVLNHCVFEYRPWELIIEMPRAYLVHSKFFNYKDSWNPNEHLSYMSMQELKESLQKFVSDPRWRDYSYPSVFLSWLRVNLNVVI